MKRLFKLLCWLLILACLAIILYLGAGLWTAERRETRAAADYAPMSRGKYVAAGEVQIFVQQAGPIGGKTVVLIHGTGAWSETWRGTMTALAKAGYRVYAMDIPPFGYSQRPANGDYSKAAQGRRILAAIRNLELPAVLVGHSFGGGATMEAALQGGHAVRGVILVDAALSIREDSTAPVHNNQWLSMLLDSALARKSLSAAFLTDPGFTRRLIGSFVATPSAITDSTVAVYQEPLYLQGTTQAVSDWLPYLLQPPAPSPSEDPAAYAQLVQPLRLIWGDLDTITPPLQAQKISQLNRNAPVTLIEGVGHIPQIENPERFNEVLLKNLAAIYDGK